MQIEQILTARKSRVEDLLSELLRSQASSPVLQKAMTYAVLNGGKRLRPVLAYASAQAVGADYSLADIAASAVELIHTYSLIHDDLPAMDDDALRRGVATCHIEFDEATAILAGDALQSYAFELLASSDQLTVSNEIRLEMLVLLAKAIGATGMVAGQSLDLQTSSKNINDESLEIWRMQLREKESTSEYLIKFFKGAFSRVETILVEKNTFIQTMRNNKH